MRYYDITVGDLHYTSLGGPSGNYNAGSLNVEIEIELAASDVANSARFRVWGCGMADISQSRSLFNQPCSIKGGMMAGLPLANPAEAGPLAHGTVYQAFGNWVGTEQTLDVILTGTSAPAAEGSGGPKPLPTTQDVVMNWKKGQPLGPAVQQALQQAYPGRTVNLAIGQYVAQNDQAHFAGSIENFAAHIRQFTQYLQGAQTKQAQSPKGVGIHFTPDGQSITVFDGSQPQQGGQINYQDLIGQPTWIGVDTISIKLVMRGDLHVGQTITLPRTIVTTTSGGGSTQLGSTASGAPQSSLTFQGTFSINVIRHFGVFRQPDAAAWVTVVEATTVSGGA